MEKKYEKHDIERPKGVLDVIHRSEFRLTRREREEIKRRDELEYKASHPELFPEYNFLLL